MQPAKFGSWSSRPRFARRSRSAGSNGRTATGLHRRGEASRSFSCRCSPARPLPEPYCCRPRRIRDTLRCSHRAGITPGSSRPGPTRSRRHRGRSARQPPPGRTRSLIHLRPRRNQPRSRQPPSNRAPVRKHPSRSIWFYAVAAIVLVVLVLAALIAARLLFTRFAWRRVRRRLAAGAPADQVTGAWAWTRMRLEACRLPLAVDVSPDVVVAGRAMDDVPAGVDTPLRVLAAATTKAAFSHEQSLSAARGRGCVEGGGQDGGFRTRAPDEARPGAPRVPWPGLHGTVALMAARSRSTWSGYAPLDADAAVQFQAAVSDIREGLRRRRSWSYLAVENVKNRYRRTVLGPWWLTLQMADLHRRHQHRLRAAPAHGPEGVPAVRRGRIHGLHAPRRPDERGSRCVRHRLEHVEEHPSAAQQPRVA